MHAPSVAAWNACGRFGATPYRRCNPSSSNRKIEHNIPSLWASIRRVILVRTSFRDAPISIIFSASSTASLGRVCAGDGDLESACRLGNVLTFAINWPPTRRCPQHHTNRAFISRREGAQLEPRTAGCRMRAAKAEWDYRPDAFWPRSAIHVEAAFATNRFSSSVMVHSTYPIVWPRRTTVPSALSCACQTGRKKLIFNSTVVKDSSGARVLANAMPIAASAISQRTPPCSVPMGFACCGPAAKTTVARPSAISFASNPIRRAIGTSFVFARSLKSACEGISWVLMTCRLRPSISAHELWFRGIPPNDGRRDQEALYYAADDSPSRFLQECWQSGWPILPNRHRNGPRLVVAHPRQLTAYDQAKNLEPDGLSPATGDCHRRNRWPCSAAGSLPAPTRCAGPESSARFV